METRSFLLLKTFVLVLVVIAESAVIPGKPTSKPSGLPVIVKDNKLETSTRIGIPALYDSSTVEYVRSVASNPNGRPTDYDYNGPGANDNNEPGIKPEIIPEYEDETIDKGDGPSKPDDEENFEPFEGDENEKEDDEDEESKPPTDEYDEDEELKPSTDEIDKKVPEENINEVLPEEEEDRDKETDEEGDKEGDEENDGNSSDRHDDSNKNPFDDDNRHEKDSGHFFGGSIFDTPFFNLNKVRRYFNQMERALAQVFHQVLDEARLLNGTYANTTEEEVQIGGRKYVVQKSVIKGADNRNSIYVETLSTKPKGHQRYQHGK